MEIAEKDKYQWDHTKELVEVLGSVIGVIASATIIPNTWIYLFWRGFYYNVRIPAEYIHVGSAQQSQLLMVICIGAVWLFVNGVMTLLLARRWIRMVHVLACLGVETICILILWARWCDIHIITALKENFNRTSMEGVLYMLLGSLLCAVAFNLLALSTYIAREGANWLQSIRKKAQCLRWKKRKKGNDHQMDETTKADEKNHCERVDDKLEMGMLEAMLGVKFSNVKDVIVYAGLMSIAITFIASFLGKEIGFDRVGFKIYAEPVAVDSQVDDEIYFTNNQNERCVLYPIVFENEDLYVLAKLIVDDSKKYQIDYSYYREIPKEKIETYYVDDYNNIDEYFVLNKTKE